jgi:YegS/Rv2252/BmrU family lipid kinase
MTDKKRIRFIINPHSGTSRKHDLPAMIHALLDPRQFEPEVVFTQAPLHAIELAREAVRSGYPIVVAVGGDGSVNETATGLAGSKTALGIVPTGSGNGLARHLGMPMGLRESIGSLNTGRQQVVDTFRVNERFGIGTVGFGFDAHIAHLFAKAGTRGYSTYVRLVLTEFHKYRPREFQFTVDGHPHSKESFLFTFANSSQFGNNAVIAPFADLQDGFLDVAILRRFPLYTAPHLIYRLTHNTLHQSRYYDMLRGREVLIRNSGALEAHIDGEPVVLQDNIHIRMEPASLQVLTPQART